MNRRIKSYAYSLNEVFPFALGVLRFLTGKPIKNFIFSLRDFVILSRQISKIEGKPKIEWQLSLSDRNAEAGKVPKHYFLQDIWAAKKVRASGARRHHDIASRLDGFIAHCLVFCSVTMLDIRPLKLKIKGLNFEKFDLLSTNKSLTNKLVSLSSLHVLEHIGLGRYGDNVNLNGPEMAIQNIQSMLMSGANLYVSVPIGKERIVFNSHRVFNADKFIKLFNSCDIIEFSAIDDNDVYLENSDPKLFESSNYSCGLFHFKKR